MAAIRIPDCHGRQMQFAHARDEATCAVCGATVSGEELHARAKAAGRTAAIGDRVTWRGPYAPSRTATAIPCVILSLTPDGRPWMIGDDRGGTYDATVCQDSCVPSPVPLDRIPDRHRGYVEPFALASPLSVAAVRHSAALVPGIAIHADPDCPRDTFGIVSDGKVTWHPVPVVVREPADAQAAVAARQRRMVNFMTSPVVPTFTIRTSAGDISVTSDPTLKPDEFVIRNAPPPLDPLDVEYDGHPLRWLLKMDTKARQENVTAQCTRSCFTPAQRAAVSAHWSAELRAKVTAGKAADKEREVSVRCEGDWIDEVAW